MKAGESFAMDLKGQLLGPGTYVLQSSVVSAIGSPIVRDALKWLPTQEGVRWISEMF